jgi:integrase
VEEAISRFTPYGVGAKEAAFARSVVTASEPVSVSRARSLLWAVSRLGAFCSRRGIELDPEVVLRISVIERFMAEDCKYSPGGRRTMRTNLLWLNRRLLDKSPGLRSFPRERRCAPYSSSEISAYLALADAQPTESRQMRAVAIISLGAGAGLLGADLRLLRGSDIRTLDGAVVAYVRGARARTVPVRAEFADRVLCASAWAGSGFVIGGAEPQRRNLTSRLVASLAGGGDLGRLSLSRLRSTWLVACASDIGLATFMAAAGVHCSQRLGDLAVHLDPGDIHRSIEVLGARC